MLKSTRVLHELAREGPLLLRARGLLEHGRERGERRDCHLRRNSRGVWGEDTTGGQFGVDGSSARGGQIWAPRGVLGRARIRARSGASARASGSAETYLESTDQGRRLGGVAGVVRLPERLQGLGRGREVRHLPFSVQTITSVDAGRSLARSALRACDGEGRAASSVSWRGFAPNLFGPHEPLVVTRAEVPPSRGRGQVRTGSVIWSVGHRPARETRVECGRALSRAPIEFDLLVWAFGLRNDERRIRPASSPAASCGRGTASDASATHAISKMTSRSSSARRAVPRGGQHGADPGRARREGRP